LIRQIIDISFSFRESGIHVLQFEGQNRITEPSIKNFQLISERKGLS